MTYGTLISSVTVGAGGAASISFSSIPGTYTDLTVVYSTRDGSASINNNLFVTFNGSATGYSERALYGNGASASSFTGGSTNFQNPFSAGANATANTFANGMIIIPNYTAAVNKTVSFDLVSENNAATASSMLQAGLWSNTAAITSITLASNGSTLVQNSTAYLYGILKGSGGATVS